MCAIRVLGKEVSGGMGDVGGSASLPVKTEYSGSPTPFVFFLAVLLVLLVLAILVFPSAWSAMFGVIAFVSLGFLPACVAIKKEWEEAIVLRFGKFQRLVGSGVFFKWPLAESFLKQDKRIVTLDVSRQEVMTRDNISVSIKVSKFSLFFGLVAFLMGGAGIIGYSLPLIPTIMILVGLFIIVSALRKMAK